MGGDIGRRDVGVRNLHVPFNRLIRSFLFCELVTVYVTFENLRVSSIRVACRVSMRVANVASRQSPVASRPSTTHYTTHVTGRPCCIKVSLRLCLSCREDAFAGISTSREALLGDLPPLSLDDRPSSRIACGGGS